jgi:hypothetical protein
MPSRQKAKAAKPIQIRRLLKKLRRSKSPKTAGRIASPFSDKRKKRKTKVKGSGTPTDA